MCVGRVLAPSAVAAIVDVDWALFAQRRTRRAAPRAACVDMVIFSGLTSAIQEEYCENFDGKGDAFFREGVVGSGGSHLRLRIGACVGRSTTSKDESSDSQIRMGDSFTSRS